MTEIEKLQQENAYLREENRILRERLSELERMLGLNSKNSSKPPSSDGLRKPAPKSLREKGKNPSGGQRGHKGHTLMAVTKPEHVQKIQLDECPNCQRNLQEIAPKKLVKRQVFDLPKLGLEVTEFQVEQKQCPCCKKKVCSEFPTHVRAPVQYGPRFRAFITYAQNQHFLPEDRLSLLCKDLFQVSIAKATIAQISLEASEKLEEFEKNIAEVIKKAPVKNVDETPLRINGKHAYLHTMSTPTDTWYRIELRGNIVEGVEGIVVRDHWAAYKKMKDVTHAFCNAHHLRELEAIETFDKEYWAKSMKTLLFFVCRTIKKGRVNEKMIEKIEKRYDGILEQALAYYESLPPLGSSNKKRPKRRVGHNLALRLRDCKAGVLLCLREIGVPFTNNLAEQDLRMMKIRQKISGGFRNLLHAKAFCRIRSYISTMRKRKQNIFQSIQLIFASS